jgi:hypothetical protein
MLRVQKLPEDVYLATSDEAPGLVAQARTAAAVRLIAEDVASKLIEASRDFGPRPNGD